MNGRLVAKRAPALLLYFINTVRLLNMSAESVVYPLSICPSSVARRLQHCVCHKFIVSYTFWFGIKGGRRINVRSVNDAAPPFQRHGGCPLGRDGWMKGHITREQWYTNDWCLVNLRGNPSLGRLTWLIVSGELWNDPWVDQFFLGASETLRHKYKASWICSPINYKGRTLKIVFLNSPNVEIEEKKNQNWKTELEVVSIQWVPRLRCSFRCSIARPSDLQQVVDVKGCAGENRRP